MNCDETTVEKDKPCKTGKIARFLLIAFSILVLIETSFVVTLVYRLVKINNQINTLAVSKAETVSESFENTMNILADIDKYYSESYVGDINYDDLTLKMANTLILAYGDKYGLYLSPKLAADEDAEMNNKVHGIGVLVRAEYAESEDDFDRFYVIQAYDGSDAKDKGIDKGCLLTHVNGEKIDFSDGSTDNDIAKIRGEEGTTVELTFLNTEGEEITTVVDRKNVDTTTVEYKVINNSIGYIEITDFSLKTDEEFADVLKYMKHRGINKFIFDLRGNTGGLLDTVVNMLDTLLPEQDIIYIENKDGEILQTYSSDKNSYDFECVCIVNSMTASASELFAKTLQEQGHKVIGEKSYGKGTVCSVERLADGGTLQFSTYRYLTADKVCVEDIGVVPDVEMKLPESKEKILYKLDISDDDIVVESIKMLSE